MKAYKARLLMLLERRMDYHPHGIPTAIRAITFGADTQDDRIECETIGWGPGEESWSLDYRTFFGDTELTQVWDEFDAYLLSARYTREDGKQLRIHAGIIDSGGHRRVW